MNVETDSQAMTEVALGLAMAFFAMMILAMMSMSMPRDDVAGLAISKVTNTTFKEGVKVVANSKVATGGEGELQESTVLEDASEENIIIFYQGRYLDISLQPLDVAALGKKSGTSFSTTTRYILALSPDLPLSDALIAREKISSPNLTITQLDEAWMKRLAL